MPADPQARYRDALACGEFRALFGSQLVSIAGTSVAGVALTVLIYARTASPLLASLAFALGFLPYLAGGLLSALVDRLPPRRLVVGCDLGSSLCAAAMAWPRGPIALLLGLLVAMGTLTSLSSGARALLVRETVSAPAYVPARSLLRIAGQVAQITGSGLAGALLVVLSPSQAMLVNAACFALSAAVIRLGVSRRLPAQQVRTGTAERLLRDSLDGVRAIVSLPEIRRLLLLAWLVPAFEVAPEALAAPYVHGLGGSPAVVGWWLTAFSIGIVLGDLVGVWTLAGRWQERLIGPAAAATFVPYLAFAVRPPIPIAFALVVLAGSCSLYALGVDRRLRASVPDELFGRVMALSTAGLMTFQGLGFLLAGAIGQLVGAPWAITIAGIGGLVSVMLFRPRRYQADKNLQSGLGAPSQRR